MAIQYEPIINQFCLAIRWLGKLTLLQLLDSPFPSGQSGTWGAQGVLVMPSRAEEECARFSARHLVFEQWTDKLAAPG
jgi:hypothetical protein